MDSTYVHTRPRSQFGRQCLFSDRGPEILDSIPPNRRDFEEYILKDPVNQGCQVSYTFAEHEVNTQRANVQCSGMNHTEGGWPKDINFQDPEQTIRYRRKTEKDEIFNRTVSDLCRAAEHTILQNNAVNIYERYFEECESTLLVESCTTRTVNVYRDQQQNKRPGTHLSWSPDGGTKLAVSHCITDFQASQIDISTDCYIWDIENPNVPLNILSPSIPMVNLEYNQKDPNSLVGGLATGQVSAWDARASTDPVEVSHRENSHREPVSTILWINSKSGTEFFSSSTDGTVKWWDTRKLEMPTETLVIDLVKPDEQDMSRALGLTALEYEPTIPTRYIMGSDMGMIIGGNRKGKLPSEKLIYKYQASSGPIYKLMRNPSFLKDILSISEWTAKIWCEDCRESAVIWTSPQRNQLTDGAWSPTKYSAFYVTRCDGTLDIWDIINSQREPTISVKVSDDPLRSIRIHEQGRLVAVANQGGTAFLLEVSQNLATSQKNDKPLLTAMFDREARREKILEGRIREIKLKTKTDTERQAAEAKAAPGVASEAASQQGAAAKNALDPNSQLAEDEYFQTLEKERESRKPKQAEPEEEIDIAENGDIDENGEISENAEGQESSEQVTNT